MVLRHSWTSVLAGGRQRRPNAHYDSQRHVAFAFPRASERLDPGDITVSVVTTDWVETINGEDDVAELERLYVLASQAKSRRS